MTEKEMKLLGENAYNLAQDHWDSPEGGNHTTAIQMAEVCRYLGEGFPEVNSAPKQARQAIDSFRGVTEWKRGDPGNWNEVIGVTESGKVWVGQFNPVPVLVQGYFLEFDPSKESGYEHGQRTGRCISFALATQAGIDYLREEAKEQGDDEFQWHSKFTVEYGARGYRNWVREVVEPVKK